MIIRTTVLGLNEKVLTQIENDLGSGAHIYDESHWYYDKMQKQNQVFDFFFLFYFYNNQTRIFTIRSIYSLLTVYASVIRILFWILQKCILYKAYTYHVTRFLHCSTYYICYTPFIIVRFWFVLQYVSVLNHQDIVSYRIIIILYITDAFVKYPTRVLRQKEEKKMWNNFDRVCL